MIHLLRATYAHAKPMVEARLDRARELAAAAGAWSARRAAEPGRALAPALRTLSARWRLLARRTRRTAILLAAYAVSAWEDLAGAAGPLGRRAWIAGRARARELMAAVHGGAARVARDVSTRAAARSRAALWWGGRTLRAVLRRTTDVYLDWMDHRAHAPATGRLVAIPLAALAVLGMGTNPGSGSEPDEVKAAVAAEMAYADAAASLSPVDAGVAPAPAADAPLDDGAERSPVALTAPAATEVAEVAEMAEVAAMAEATRATEAPAARERLVSASVPRRVSPLDRQLSYERVARAAARHRETVAWLLADAGIDHLGGVHLRAFKREQVLEVWARPHGTREYRLVHTYAVCAASGSLGPKRARDDGQVPEGFYHIDGFNPVSAYQLSLHINYPNRADRVRSAGRDPGGAIFIHGGCVSAGCLAITDDGIEQLYWLALLARDEGQARIPVHIFPTRMDDEGVAWLRSTYSQNFVHWDFWMSLRPAYEAFEQTRQLSRHEIAAGGRYVVHVGEPAETPELDDPARARTRPLGVPVTRPPGR